MPLGGGLPNVMMLRDWSFEAGLLEFQGWQAKVAGLLVSTLLCGQPGFIRRKLTIVRD